MLSDCVYAGVVAVGNNTGCMLTSAWGINASYEHYWTPAWHTSLYGAYYAGVVWQGYRLGQLQPVLGVRASAR